MWLNYHTHSSYCDGKSSVEDLIDKAESLHVGWLGFSSHAPLPFDCAWCMKRERLEEYVNKIATLKSKRELELYAGLEVDYIPGRIGPKDFQGLDYTIGSVHFVESFPEGRGWEIDGPHAHFLEGLERIFSNDIKQVVQRYFALTRDMVIHSAPTIVGHLDKIKIQNIGNKFFTEEESWYRDEMKSTIDVIGKSGCIVEVNTRGIYQKKTAVPYPSPWVLELIHKKNIPITISSDAHYCDDLINQFGSTAILLKQIGFQEIHVLSHGQWKACKFNEDGIRKN